MWYLERAADDGQLVVQDAYAATMQHAGLASGGSRSLVKKPNTDELSRDRWVDAVLKLVRCVVPTSFECHTSDGYGGGGR